MQGKYRNRGTLAAFWTWRELLRWRLRSMVKWEPLKAAGPGCTVVIGMCSRLPDVLGANLRCLAASRWSDLRALIIAVDATRTRAFDEIEANARSYFPEVPVAFVYYSKEQSAFAERLKLPFVYSWMSWCLAIAKVQTRHLLIHDYDALIVGPALGARYDEFCHSEAKVQGIRWYDGNGILPEDRLCTTFELFCDVEWFRSMPPLSHFNKVSLRGDRSVDYDTTLWVQARLAEDQRQIIPMDLNELVHPSQMIHQYTMFRRLGPVPLPCFSMPMIPFFSALGGRTDAITRATQALDSMPASNIELFSDGNHLNLERLDVAQVDWAIKQMVQTSLRLAIPPPRDFYAYGSALYKAARAPEALHWVGDFTDAQRAWIAGAAALARGV